LVTAYPSSAWTIKESYSGCTVNGIGNKITSPCSCCNVSAYSNYCPIAGNSINCFNSIIGLSSYNNNYGFTFYNEYQNLGGGGTYEATCTCNSGDTKSGTTCNHTYTATSNYSCPAGWSLSGTTCSRTLTVLLIPGISANSCPFTDYSSPPSPWRSLGSSVSGSNTYYLFQNSNPDRKVTCPGIAAPATVPPDFAGVSIQADPQTLDVEGTTYTSGWKIVLSGYSSADVQVYCKKATP
jgi:hypothetical protein